MRKFIRLLLGLAACVVLVYASMEMADYLQESRVSVGMKESLIQGAVSVKDEATTEKNDTAPESLPESSTAAGTEPAVTAPISVDFAYLTETNADIIGWLYSEDTPINLPVVRGSDNDYYLRRMVDGSWNSAGTLFADYRNAGDFSDNITVIYGHNMKNKEMFGTLGNYGDQSYYEEHPVMWLLTAEGDYQVELVAGFVTASNASLYSFPKTEADAFDMIQTAVEKSTFTTDVQLHEEDRFLCLSTCSYEFDEARYVLIGRLVPV